MIVLYLFPIYLLISIFIFLYFFYKIIYAPYKLKTNNMNIEEVLFVLKTVINTELELYENDIFDKRGALTNANFENYYRDIVKNIIESLSDEFFFKARLFLNEEAVVSIICRTVKAYLIKKIDELNNIE